MARPANRPTDAELLRGSPEDFGAFYERHEAAVLRFFLARRVGAEVAADLTAETFARVLGQRERFDPDRGVARAWLFGIGHNVLLHSLRAGRVSDDTRRALALERLHLTDRDLARLEELDGGPAMAALDALPAGQREAVEGRIVDDLGYDELAARLGCSESVVRKRVSRGLTRLKARLEGSA